MAICIIDKPQTAIPIKKYTQKTYKSSPQTHLERLLECGPEIAIEICINYWIQCRVEVTNPEEYANNNARSFAAVTQRERDVPDVHKKEEKEKSKFHATHIISCLDNVAPYKAIIFILSSALDTFGGNLIKHIISFFILDFPEDNSACRCCL